MYKIQNTTREEKNKTTVLKTQKRERDNNGFVVWNKIRQRESLTTSEYT